MVDYQSLFGKTAWALLAMSLIATLISWFVLSYGYVEDDAFIHLEFARSVAEGRGFSFNGQVANGDTAPVWVLFLAGIHTTGLSWFNSAKLACALGVAVAISGAWCLGNELAGGRTEQRLLAPAAVAITVLNPFFAHWAFSGMESVAALGLSFWAIAIGLTGPPTLPRCLSGAVLLAIAPLVRPEFLLFDAIVAPAMLWRLWSVSGQRPWPRRLAPLAALAILMCMPLAIWSGYALEVFGAVVPNTNLAKQGAGGLRELAPRLLSVYALGFPVTLGLLPLAALAGRGGRQIPQAVWVLLLWPLVCMGFYLANHTVVQTRYALVSMPSMSVAILWLIAERQGARLSVAAAAAMALAGSVVIAAIVAPHLTNKQKYIQVLSAVSDFVREKLPPRAPVAVFAIGQIAFESRHPLVDIGGITDKSVVPYMGNPGATLRWAKAHGARYYITAEPPEPAAVRVFTMNVPFIGWSVQRSEYLTQQPIAIYALP